MANPNEHDQQWLCFLFLFRSKSSAKVRIQKEKDNKWTEKWQIGKREEKKKRKVKRLNTPRTLSLMLSGEPLAKATADIQRLRREPKCPFTAPRTPESRLEECHWVLREEGEAIGPTTKAEEILVCVTSKTLIVRDRPAVIEWSPIPTATHCRPGDPAIR